MDYLKIIELALLPVFFILVTYFGVQYGKVKEKLTQVKDLFVMLVASIEDDNISEAEMKQIIAQVKLVLGLP